MKSIKEKAHEIARQHTKYYDPIVCRQAPIAPKQEWLEMAAREGANYVLEEIEKNLDEFTNYEDSLIISRIIEQLKK